MNIFFHRLLFCLIICIFNTLFFISTVFAMCSDGVESLRPEITVYHSGSMKDKEEVIAYNKNLQTACRYLSYRDLPSIIKKYMHGKTALDYGAGTGISSQFLLDEGLDVTGVDISEAMVAQAITQFSHIPFYHLQNESLGAFNKKYDLIFSSYVLFEMENRDSIMDYLNKAKLMMKPSSIFIIVTGSSYIYSKEWIVYNNEYPENKNLKSGEKGRLYLPEANIEFVDYYWTEEDYYSCFEEAGFSILETYHPLGIKGEPYDWKDELSYSPFVIFVLKI